MAEGPFETPLQEVEGYRNDLSKFVSFPCIDIDYATISIKIGKPASEVARSLGLDEATQERIEKEETEEWRKIYRSFVAWEEKMVSESNRKTPTWGELNNCLSSLNDGTIMEAVKEYLTETYGQDVAKRQLHDIEESAQEASSDGSEPHDDDPLALCRSPLQDTGSGNGFSALVPNTTKALKDAWKRISPELRRKVRNLREKLQDITLAIQRALSHKVTSDPRVLEDLRLLVSSLSVCKVENVPYHNRHLLPVITKYSVNEIFVLLTNLKAWNILNFYVLKRIATKLLPKEQGICAAFESFEKEIDEFKADTNVVDYLQVQPRGDIMYDCSTLIAKSNTMRYSELKLAEVAEMAGFLADEFNLNDFIFQLNDLGHGCVCITWFIPKSAIPFLMPQCVSEDTRGRLIARGVVELVVDGRFMYKNPTEVTPPRELYPGNAGKEDYDAMYKKSIEEPESFWSEQGNRFLVWDEPFAKADNCSKEKGMISWFAGGKLNVSKNCLDRHVEKNPDKTAIIWEKPEPGNYEKITYRQLLEQTCRVANVLKNQCGVGKGDVVGIYMPTQPIAVATMLACARIGAVHSVVYAALKSDDLQTRIKESNCKVVVTANVVQMGDCIFPLKRKVDSALKECNVKHVLVAKNGNAPLVPFQEGRDIRLEEAMEKEKPTCEPVSMDSEDDLFIMYTSGTTDEPKGIVHGQAGYLLYAAMTHKYVFDYQEGDVFACVSVLGWITGHTYVVYGPLCNGATTVLFEGTATYPDAGRYWKMVEEHKVNQFYTTPSAIRTLMKAGEHYVEKYKLTSLKTIGSVGEPLPMDAWSWYNRVVGDRKCIVVDTYWQTETGGVALSPQPGPAKGSLKRGYSMRPFFGVEPVITDEKGEEIIVKQKKPNGVQGLLCFRGPTPGMGIKVITKDGAKSFRSTYFNSFSQRNDLYFTRDWVYRDVDGDYQIVGRREDIIRIKGVWIQLPEIESKMAQQDEHIQAASLIRVTCKTRAANASPDDDSTCAVLEVEENLKEEKYREIVDKVVKFVHDYLGERVKPIITVLCPKQTQTLSTKISRPAMRKELTDNIQKITQSPPIVSDKGNKAYRYNFTRTEMG